MSYELVRQISTWLLSGNVIRFNLVLKSVWTKGLGSNIKIMDPKIAGMRQPYKRKNSFIQDNVIIKEPIELFRNWFDQACNTEAIKEANAMVLTTADRSGKPSSRFILLKGYGKNGFAFFTNHQSRKGQELEANPHASLLFYWDHLSRQVRIEGSVERLSEEDSEKYFHSRPRSSQISAVISKQSSVIPNREYLIEKQLQLEKEYSDPNKIIPKPDYWGGYRVIPEVIEFWQGQTDRLHDRIRFRHPLPDEVIDEKLTHKGEDGWIFERLSP